MTLRTESLHEEFVYLSSGLPQLADMVLIGPGLEGLDVEFIDQFERENEHDAEQS